MDPAARRPLGRTPVRVTQLGFGAGPIAGTRVRVSEPDAYATIAAAYQGGVRYFDTAPYYGYGRSELRLGAGLREHPRDEIVISSKIGRWMRPRPDDLEVPEFRTGSLDFFPTFDYSYDGVHRSLEQTLLRVGLNHVDILYVHDVDFWTTRDRDLLEQRFREVMSGAHKALVGLRAAGVIGAFGLGLNEADTAARFVRAGDFDCVLLAGRYTLLEQGALADFMPLCEQRKIGVVIGGPLNSGILATGPVQGALYNYAPPPPEIADRVRRIAAACERHNVEMPAAALQFPLAHPAVASVIPGAASADEQRQNVALFKRPIPPELWVELRSEGLLDPAAPIPE
jgi:D-threo-aldose 1-dehydrogenase